MLFTGDLFSRYGRPHFDFNEMKKNERWNYVKEWLLKRVDEIDKIVTGHGKILSRDDLESFIQFNNAIK
jgi:glyoxylase-like metal-dependent hydrolase (beta-lactamase superfamily II)